MNIIKKHPALFLSDHVLEICKPLFETFSLTYFRYLKVYEDGTRIFLCTDPLWMEHFYNQKYYNVAWFDREPIVNLKSGYVLWDEKAAFADNAVGVDARDIFDINHGMNIIRKHKNFCEIYDFATTHDNVKINEAYLGNIDLFNRFIFYCKERAYTLIENLERSKVTLPDLKWGALVDVNSRLKEHTKAGFISVFKLKKAEAHIVTQCFACTPFLRRPMSILIIVDGYNAAKVFPKILTIRGYSQCLHVQSSENLLNKFSPPDFDDYLENFIYQGDLEVLLTQIKISVGANTILGVIAGSEPGVELADKLAECLQLSNSNGTTLSSARRDKYLMLEALSQKKIKTCRYIKSKKLQEIQNWAQDVGYPIVLKPLKSAGTDGVYVCNNNQELSMAFHQVINRVNHLGEENLDVLVQSFIRGDEYVVNTVSCRGKHKVFEIWKYRKKYLAGHGYIYDREELINFEGPIQKDLINYVFGVLDALGIQYGPCHSEIIYSPEGPILVEAGARISGATNVDVQQECLG